MEVWKEIPSWRGYEVSNKGRVRTRRKIGCKVRLGKDYRFVKTRINKNGYVTFRLGLEGKCVFLHKIMYHLFVKKVPKKLLVDHKDRNKLNNKLSNFRLATKSQNNHNARKRKGNYKGAYFDKINRRWTAQICVNYKKKFLGYFDTEKEAAIAYNVAAIKLHKNFAVLNEVD